MFSIFKFHHWINDIFRSSHAEFLNLNKKINTSSYLHQVLIYPFCKCLLLHSVSFICEREKEKGYLVNYKRRVSSHTANFAWSLT